jgi:outer membrane protein OmpA-like peptidoglycan-associated protein
MAEDEEKTAGKPGGGETEEAKPQESAWTALLKTLGEKALTALLTLGGLAAFAAFAGSLVLWTRFDALELPPDQIVDLIPREEAVTTGTTILLLFGFCGAVAALAVYLIDRGGRATPGMSRGVLLIVAVEATAAIWLTHGTAALDRVIATEVVVLAFGAIVWVTQVGGLTRLEKGVIPDLIDGEPDQEIRPGPFRQLRDEGQMCEEGKARKKSGSREKFHESRVGWPKVLIALGICLALGGAAWMIVRFSTDSISRGWAVGLAVLGMALLAAVAVQWIVFQRGQKEATRRARVTDEKRRAAEKERHDEEEKRRKRAAKKALTLAKAAWLFSWLKAGMERGKEGPGFTLSFGAPEGALSPAPKEEPEAAPKDQPRAKPPLLELTPYGTVAVIPLVLAAVLAPALILGERWLAITLAATILIGIGLWRIAELSSGGFILYGLAIFLSAPLFGTVALTTRNIDDPQAQPVAIIRGGDGPAEALQGLYVTETSDRVYFANVATQDCGKNIVDDSGRLFWVPKSEVVAMAIGPSQDVDKAARASLEMAYELTPEIETSEGGHVSLVTKSQAAPEGGKGGAGTKPGGRTGAKETEPMAKRLQSAGPAVRPKFGIGLRLSRETASAGDRVKLLVPSPEFHGLAGLREGSSLRLNGVDLPVLRRKVASREDDELRREWIEFEVPQNAASGVVTVECTQLAGQPFLTVPQQPTARVTMRMKAGSRRVIFDSGDSSGSDGASTGLVRRWTVAGLHMGRGVSVTADLPPRLAPYHVRLDLTDAKGQADHVDLQVLRLPQSRFPLGEAQPRDVRPMHRVREALRKAIEASPPAAIEIDGHADSIDSDEFNLGLSLRRARWIRRQLFVLHRDAATAFSAAAPDAPLPNGGDPVPLTIRAFGESCPIVHRPGPQAINRRVEVFLLDPGATVAAPMSCQPVRIKRLSW